MSSRSRSTNGEDAEEAEGGGEDFGGGVRGGGDAGAFPPAGAPKKRLKADCRFIQSVSMVFFVCQVCQETVKKPKVRNSGYNGVWSWIVWELWDGGLWNIGAGDRWQPFRLRPAPLQVDAHVKKCPSCWVLTCVDCGVNFEGEAYRSHTSCVSEAQKYQKSLYQPVRRTCDAYKRTILPFWLL